MHNPSNQPTAREESPRPWRAAPPKGSPWNSDLEVWESLDSESVHHVPQGTITPEMKAESIRDARPFWWAQSAHAAVTLVEDIDRPDAFRVVQADTLTKLVALLRNGVEWPDFVTVSERFLEVEFDTIRDRAFRLMCAADNAAFALQAHGFEADPMAGRWVYRLGKRRARIASIPEIPHCWAAIPGTGSTGELLDKSGDEIHAEVAQIMRKRK